MENYIGSIDTDIGIGSILSNFETPWIMHSIQDSLNMKFRPFAEPMPNFVNILQRQFDAVAVNSPDYKDQVEETRNETYKEIIGTICDYYGLVFTKPFEEIHPTELFGIASTMYDIFISRFTQYMIDFYIRYIINNADNIIAYLGKADGIHKPKERDFVGKNYIDPKFVIIHQNLNMIVMNMVTYDISLNDLLGYFLNPNQAVRMMELLNDTGDIYKNHYAIYLQDQRFMADILTVIKLELQSKTQELYQIKVPTNEEENVEEGE